jgi:hypothetical protein
MSRHYVHDALISGTNGAYGCSKTSVQLIEYHFLRVMGCAHIWECGGSASNDPGHVPDGSMQVSGTGSYTPIGTGPATLLKDTATKRSGIQSLKITSYDANDGVQTSILTGMTAAGSESLNGDTIGNASAGITTLSALDNSYYTDIVGCRAILSGCTNLANNGTFNVTAYVSSSSIRIDNPSGVAETPGAGATLVTQRRYEVDIWALNNSGHSWTVSADPGTGVIGSIGSITSDGVWTLYHFYFYLTGAGNRYVYITDPVGSSYIHVNGINVYRSHFEYRVSNIYGTGGTFTNPDLLLTSGHTPTANNTGMYLFVCDTGVPNNSGCYEILGVSGGKYQLSMRGSKTFNPTGSVVTNWRIVDIDNQKFDTIDIDNGYFPGWSGFGLESLHTSKWRYFNRLLSLGGYTSRNRYTVCWGSPVDCDFNFSSGEFYKTGPSTTRGWCIPYSNDTGDTQYQVSGGGNTNSYDRSVRVFMMTDDTVSFFSIVGFDVGRAGDSFGFFGYTGADPTMPGIEEFAFLCKYDTTYSGTASEFGFDGGATRAFRYGVMFDEDGIAIPVCAGVVGVGASTVDPMSMSSACVNPWSGLEHVDPVLLIRDPTLIKQRPAEKEITVGLYMGRTNLATLATFDSANYLHFVNGLVWAWDGCTVL